MFSWPSNSAENTHCRVLTLAQIEFGPALWMLRPGDVQASFATLETLIVQRHRRLGYAAMALVYYGIA